MTDRSPSDSSGAPSNEAFETPAAPCSTRRPAPPLDGDRADLDALVRLVERLRAPDGCAWDREQTFESVRANLLEEAHEAAAAVDSGDRGELVEELGDLLFQVAFYGRLLEEEGTGDLNRAVASVHAKMVERHPHVFGDGPALGDSAAVRRAWEAGKAARRAAAGAERGVLDGVPAHLPALTGAHRLGQKAAAVGFDWPTLEPVIAKVREELDEVETARADLDASRAARPDAARDTARRAALDEEVGDLLFAVSNLARHLEIDPEGALARANAKFRRRFGAVEARLSATGESVVEADLDTMESAWEAVKDDERAASIEPLRPGTERA